MTTINTEKLQEAFTYPFKDPRWKYKFLIGGVIGLLNLLIIPALFLTGYAYRIMKRVIVDQQPLAMPEWDDWGKLFLDGLRLWGVSFIYSLPIYGIFLVSLLSFLVPAIWSTENSGAETWIPVGAVIYMLGIGLSMLFALPVQIILPAAVSHMVARDRFMAAFQIKEWWPILKANWGGFLISAIAPFVISMILGFASQLLMMTIVLSCLLPFVMAGASVYNILVAYGLYAQAYVDAVAHLGSGGLNTLPDSVPDFDPIEENL